MTALRVLAASVVTALGHPRVWLTAWLVVTAAALTCVWPVWLALDEELGTHPGATYTLDQALDADFARLHAGAAVSLGGACLAVALAFVFLGGAVLAGVGSGRRFRYATFLAEGARLFPRNLRVVALGVVVAAALCFGIGHLDRWIREDLVYGWDTGPVEVLGWKTRWLSLELGLEALSWLWGLLFLLVVFVSKMAMARLAALDRRSATWAWLRAAGTAARHPVRTVAVVGLWALAWFAGSFGLGWLTMQWLEREQETGVGLAIGQANVLWTQVMLVALLLAARRLAVPEAAPPAAGSRRDSDPARDPVAT